MATPVDEVIYLIHVLLKLNLKKPISIITLLVFIILIVSGCSKSPKHFEDTRFVLGTVVSIKAWGEEAEMAVLNGFDQIEELEQKLDQHNQESEIARLNNYFNNKTNEKTEPIEISPELCNVIALGLDYGEKTKGKYDITIGPLVQLWITKEKDHILPVPNEINSVKSLINYKKVELDIKHGTIDMEPGMILDLGSIAKGYIAQQAISTIKKHNISGAIINAGGNVVTTGNNIDGKWKIGLANPQKPDSLIGHLSFAGDKTVVSAGNYQQYYLIKERKYGHILNLDTGWPHDEVLGVSVMGADSAMADVLSTAALVVGVQEGLDLIQNAGYEGLIIDKTGKLHKTEGLDQYFHESLL